MKRVEVKNSTNVKSIGFDGGILEIEFKKGIYQYSPVTNDQFINLVRAESKTTWLNNNIKNNPTITFKKVG